MTEKEFIEKNKGDWQSLEKLLKAETPDADKLHVLFLKVTGDLSYAQTYFPRRSIRWYLNSLANSIFDSMRTKNRLDIWGSISKFYTYTLPSEVLRNKSALLVSLFIFSLAVCIGIYSTLHDVHFVDVMLGKEYVEMTKDNIASGDPMAVYKSGSRYDSFFGITVNNIKVAFLAFVTGILAGVGCLFVLISNGIMLGAFQTFFYTQDLLLTSMLSIWIHGTIEILSIIIAGAAGLIIGKHLLFPQTFTRLQSLKIGAVRAMIIMLSTVPLFVVAGCFEAFVTPKTEFPDFLKATIIFASLAFMILLYIVQPYLLHKKGLFLEDSIPLKLDEYDDKSTNIQESNYVKRAIAFYNQYLEEIFKYVVIPASIIYAILYYVMVPILYPSDGGWAQLAENSKTEEHVIFLIVRLLLFIYFLAFAKSLIQEKSKINLHIIVNNTRQHFPIFALASLVMILPGYLLPSLYLDYYLYFIFPIPILTYLVSHVNDQEADIHVLKRSFNLAYKHYMHLLIPTFICMFVFYLLNVMIVFSSEFLTGMLSWHNLFEDQFQEKVFIRELFSHLTMWIVWPMVFLIFYFGFDSILNKLYSFDIRDQVEKFVLMEEEY